ncbi:serine--tRNA ligase [Candidatus Woesearchaeota archaeon]|nr:serine--tRNA ligase [Candidatus Woesearchaeota archaeon]
MLDLNYIREHPEIVKTSEKRRHHDPAIVDKVLNLDLEWKKELKVMEELKHKRNVVSEEINQAKKQKNETLAVEKITQMRAVAESIKKTEEKVNLLLTERNATIKTIGNILDKTVPEGKDESENKELRKVGKIPKFNFPIKDHIELGLELDLIDLETAAKNSGARFYYLKNEAVLLSQALQRFAIDRLLKKGYTVIQTPYMLNKAALEGGVNLSEFQDTIYKIENEDLYLIGTSEHPLVALKKDQTLEEKELPFKICGVSACFRKELGAHGRDTKGIFRVHQFNKVEQIVYCKPEDSEKFFQEMERNSEEMFKELGLPFRVVAICTGDIGNKQALQYDIEAWFPGQNEKKGFYREVTSCSNCKDYQSVTLNTKFLRKDGNKEYVHILNNTALTDTRPIIAILENFQTAKGTVKIPKALWPYMSGIKEIKKKDAVTKDKDKVKAKTNKIIKAKSTGRAKKKK